MLDGSNWNLIMSGSFVFLKTLHNSLHLTGTCVYKGERAGLMSFYCLVWLWRQLIEIKVLRNWKIFCKDFGDFLLFSKTPPLSFKIIRSLWKDCFFLDEKYTYGLMVFQNFFWSECLSLQILEKWSLILFLLMLTALSLSWQYFSQSSGFLDLVCWTAFL